MRRYLILTPLLVLLAAPVAHAGSPLALGSPVATAAPKLVALRGFGGGGFRSRGLLGRSRPRGFFGGRSRPRSRGLFGRIARGLAFAYVLHLLFTHGGLSVLVWLILIALIVSLMRRRRSRRMAY